MAFNFGTNSVPSTGNNMFGGFNNTVPNTGMFGMPTVQPNNLQVLSTTSREFAENYNVPVFRNCCQTFGIKNNSTIPILANNYNVIFARPDLGKSY